MTLYIITKKSRYIDAEGVAYLIGIIHDVTELHKNHEALQRKETALKALNDRKDKILSVISHDLRTPMNTVLSLVSLLKAEVSFMQASEECSMLVEPMERSTKAAQLMLDGLIEWARDARVDRNLTLTKVDLPDLLHRVVAALAYSVEQKGILIDSSSMQLSSAVADERMLRIILRNLLQNAVKFSHPKGVVRVSGNETDEAYVLSFEDDGVGMSNEIQNMLFTSDFTTSNEGTWGEKGSGLGLSLCNELIDSLGGQITVKSTIDRGSTFTVSLPKQEVD